MREFSPPEELRVLIERVAAMAGERAVDAWVVGGTVRDVLLGRETRDLDIALTGDAVGLGRALADRLGGHFVLLDDERAVARVVLREGSPDAGGAVDHIDVAHVAGTLEQDLRRRDFTIDALAVPVGTSGLIDVVGGLADLDARIVRMNGAHVFEEDPLRLLRGVRIASELGFGIAAETEGEMRRHAASVVEAAAERQRDELARIFALDSSYAGVRLLDRIGLLDVVLPELAAGRGVTQPEQFHAYDVFEHNMRALEAMDVMLGGEQTADGDWQIARSKQQRAGTGQQTANSKQQNVADVGIGWLYDVVWEAFGWAEAWLREYLDEEMSEGRRRASLLKIATLLHDVGKPATRSVDADGRVRFFGHGDVGAEMASKVMRRLRFSTRETAFVAKLVEEHLRPVQLAQVGEAPTRRALYRFWRDLGDAAPAVLLLALADAAAARGGGMTREGMARQAAYMNSLLVRSIGDEGIVDLPRLLTGHDIMSETGMPGGPAIGAMLEAVSEAQAAGEIHSREEALALVRKLAREGSSER